MRTLFIADLHLSADRPDITQAFYRFLDTQLDNTQALYILGDLFEVWVGDDIAEPFAIALAAKLKHVSTRLPVYFIHGNRDFLLGKHFAASAGMILLPEVHRLNLYGKAVVILHGDSLCTLDRAYQRFRKFRSLSWVRWLYCQLPRQTRQGIADKLRNKSKQSNQNKSYSIMDVAPESVEELMRQTGAELMIHGHTHRPAIHELTHDRRRLVVGDWYQQGSVLSITPDSASLDVLPFDGACP